MSQERWILEGEWSGYTSAQQHVVHREVISKQRAERIAKSLPGIRYTDGTSLWLSVRRALPREKVQTINGYGSLIGDCLALGVTAVDQIDSARKARREAAQVKA